MIYNEYVISKSGASSYRIAVPCFYGDGSDFDAAARMNRFYSSVLSEMYRYAEKNVHSDMHRRVYNCSFTVNEDDAGSIRVGLFISERVSPKDRSRSTTKKKEVSHVWRGGVIIQKAVR